MGRIVKIATLSLAESGSAMLAHVATRAAAASFPGIMFLANSSASHSLHTFVGPAGLR
jgi:hypothetical protein